MGESFRKPSPAEVEIMQKLLSADFPGKETIARQLADSRVRVIDNEGSLEIEPSGPVERAAVTKRVPVEAEAADEDGVIVHLLLHVNDGFVKEIEVYKDDGSPIKRMPLPGSLEVIVLPA